mmetsp:Transcript_28563/g.88566  ORF Transcript_28563/g.88566 Transcript_28563/m.88566 type:complete len:100 (+) Transcript_28563:88-387(+)
MPHPSSRADVFAEAQGVPAAMLLVETSAPTTQDRCWSKALALKNISRKLSRREAFHLFAHWFSGWLNTTAWSNIDLASVRLATFQSFSGWLYLVAPANM